jgi:hypothetical protein
MIGGGLRMVHFGGETLDGDLIESYKRVNQSAERGSEGERFESLAVISDQDQLIEYVRRRTGQLDDFGYVLAPEGRISWGAEQFSRSGAVRTREIGQ